MIKPGTQGLRGPLRRTLSSFEHRPHISRCIRATPQGIDRHSARIEHQVMEPTGKVLCCTCPPETTTASFRNASSLGAKHPHTHRLQRLAPGGGCDAAGAACFYRSVSWPPVIGLVCWPPKLLLAGDTGPRAGPAALCPFKVVSRTRPLTSSLRLSMGESDGYNEQ